MLRNHKKGEVEFSAMSHCFVTTYEILSPVLFFGRTLNSSLLFGGGLLSWYQFMAYKAKRSAKHLDVNLLACVSWRCGQHRYLTAPFLSLIFCLFQRFPPNCPCNALGRHITHGSQPILWGYTFPRSSVQVQLVFWKSGLSSTIHALDKTSIFRRRNRPIW